VYNNEFLKRKNRKTPCKYNDLILLSF